MLNLTEMELNSLCYLVINNRSFIGNKFSVTLVNKLNKELEKYNRMQNEARFNRLLRRWL